MSVETLAREQSNPFRDAYKLAKAEANRKQPRSITPPRTGSRDWHPENWFTGTWADVDDVQLDCYAPAAGSRRGIAPRSPRSEKWDCMEADMASHCEEGPTSALLARSLPTSPPSAASSPSEAGVKSAISALRPWMQTMRGRALGAFAFPAERVWLRACISAWRQLAESGIQRRAAKAGGHREHCGHDRLAEGLADALEVLRSYIASPTTTAAGLVLRLRRLHNEIGEMWTQKLKGMAASHDGDDSSSIATASSVGTDESSVSFFHRCLQDMVAQQSKVSNASVAQLRNRSLSTLGVAELTALKSSLAHENCFRRFRGALSFAAGVWSSAYDRTEDWIFQAAVKRVLSVLFTLDAITHALPGTVEREQDAFRIQDFSILEEVPPPLLEALQQLGPL